MNQTIMAANPQRLLPALIFRDERFDVLEDLIREACNRHQGRCIGRHACGYGPGPEGDNCDLCDAHSDSCVRCDQLIHALAGLEALTGDFCVWDWEGEDERLYRIRVCREVVAGLTAKRAGSVWSELSAWLNQRPIPARYVEDLLQ